MIIVTGTKRSGTSLWMRILATAGVPIIGERFPAGWGELLRAANPDGFFESELVAGINFRTNPHPLTGAYLSPSATREHAVKVFIPGLVRSDVAFLDRCIATVRPWREYVGSTRRMAALQRRHGIELDEGAALPPALEWWTNNYALVRDLAIRGYPVHVLSLASLLRDPSRTITEVAQWLELEPGDWIDVAAAGVVRAATTATTDDDRELADGLEPRFVAVFDELYDAIDGERPLSEDLVMRLNATHDALRPRMLDHRARHEAAAVASVLGHRGARG
jgi:hypothetical protein